MKLAHEILSFMLLIQLTKMFLFLLASSILLLLFITKSVMASVEDLKDVLKETLDNRGVLNQIRARIRSEVFSALDDQTDVKPVLSNENLLVNELIREYLEFNKYKYSSSVLLAESGQPKDPIDREFLKAELNIKEESGPEKIPILYGLISYFLEQRHCGNDMTPTKERASPVRSSGSPKSTDGTSVLNGGQGIVYHAKR